MNKEDKELLLVDLCARLPYEVILLSQNGKVIYQTDGNTAAELLVEEGWKLYLRPMSSMTEEEFKEYDNATDLDVFDSSETLKVNLAAKSRVRVSKWYHGTDWLNTHHFDYRGLIERGLAIAVTKENNPYENVKVKQYEFPLIRQWEWDSERGCSYPPCQIDYTENNKNI